MKKAKLYYQIAITMFSIAIISIVANSYFNYEAVVQIFDHLGYPAYLIFILGAAQIIGLIILISNQGKWLLEWTYAGFFMNFTFGIIAHLVSKEGNGATAVICLVLIWVTYIQNKKLKYHKDDAKITKQNKKRLVFKKVA